MTIQLVLCKIFFVLDMDELTPEHHVFLYESYVKYKFIRKYLRKFRRKFPRV